MSHCVQPARVPLIIARMVAHIAEQARQFLFSTVEEPGTCGVTPDFKIACDAWVAGLGGKDGLVLASARRLSKPSPEDIVRVRAMRNCSSAGSMLTPGESGLQPSMSLNLSGAERPIRTILGPSPELPPSLTMARTLHAGGSSLTFTFETGKALALLLLTVYNPSSGANGAAFFKGGPSFGRLIRTAGMEVAKLDCLQMRPRTPPLHHSSSGACEAGGQSKVWCAPTSILPWPVRACHHAVNDSLSFPLDMGGIPDASL